MSFVTSQSWRLRTVVSKNEKEMKEVTRNLDTKPIRKHPDRKEIIFILAEDKYHSRTGLYYILRPKVGKPRLSEFQESEKAEHIEGTFTSLLDSSISCSVSRLNSSCSLSTCSVSGSNFIPAIDFPT